MVTFQLRHLELEKVHRLSRNVLDLRTRIRRYTYSIYRIQERFPIPDANKVVAIPTVYVTQVARAQIPYQILG